MSGQDQKVESSSSTLMQAMFESVADGVLAVDEDWRITAFNPAAACMTGVSPENAIGRKCFDVCRANICSSLCAIREAIDTGGEICHRRATIIDSAGNQVPVSVCAAPLKDETGKVIGGVETMRNLSDVERLRKELHESYSYHDIIGRSPRLRQLFKILPAVSESESTVLIEGDSGTGKELFARAVHDLSPRADAPYVVIHCSALPETLLESELFGYKKGAFTDAKHDKPGRFERAKGGSIFLDEVGTLSPAVQVKLLRVLEKKDYEPVGATETVQADVRIIAATNQPLAELVRQRKFRDDLYYRLNVVTLELPPLRDRRDDIPLLVDHFVSHYNVLKAREIEGVTPGAMRLLMEYEYPGNVRELQNIIEHAFVLSSGGLIDLGDLPRTVTESSSERPGQAPPALARAGCTPLADAEIAAIRAALTHANGHRRKAARELGISPTTLWRKMKRHGISA